MIALNYICMGFFGLSFILSIISQNYVAAIAWACALLWCVMATRLERRSH